MQSKTQYYRFSVCATHLEVVLKGGFSIPGEEVLAGHLVCPVICEAQWVQVLQLLHTDQMLQAWRSDI